MGMKKADCSKNVNFDMNYEEFFIDNFIFERYRERLLFEFRDEKRRFCAIERFSHDSAKYLDKAKISCAGEKITQYELLPMLKEITSSKTAYVISQNSFDKTIMPLRDAVLMAYGEYSAVILVIDERISFVKSEVEKSSCKKYVMSREKITF